MKAREIAQERFARGEINADEYEAIISKLGPENAPVIPPDSVPEQPKDGGDFAITRAGWYYWVVPGMVFAWWRLDREPLAQAGGMEQIVIVAMMAVFIFGAVKLLFGR